MDTPEPVTVDSWEQSLAIDDSSAETEDGQPEAATEPAAEEAPAGSDAAPDPATAEAAQPDEATSVEPQADSDEDAAETPEGEAGPPEEPEAPAAPDPKTAAQPFGFKLNGAQVDVPGAIERDGYIAMPREAWNRVVQPRLADREMLVRRESELQRQVAELHPDRNAEVQKARAIIGMIDQAVKAGPDGLYDWAEQFIAKLPVLEAEARAAAAEARANRHESEEQQRDQQQAVQEIRQQVEQTLRSEAQAILAEPEFKDLGLDPEDLHRDLMEIRGSIFFVPTEDDPARGLRAGEIVFRKDLIRRLVERVAGPVKKERARLAEVSKARRTNEAATAPAQVPPAVPARGTPAAGGKAASTPTTKEEWEESLRS